jgi:hypothetical protein
MKKVFVILVLMLITTVTLGCKKQDLDVQASPTFKSGVYTLQGIEGRIGILAPGGFIANKPNKYMWHFWGTKEELSQKPFRVEAIDLKTGDKHQALQIESIGVSPLNGADASIPSNMEFPSSGKWKLDAYLGGRLFGSVVVEVS